MSDEEMNIAIAEACGWTEIIATPHDPQPPKGRECKGANWGKPVPDYCNDLNAMHEAEKQLGGEDQLTYLLNLRNLDVYCSWHSQCATARQRAEAFLRTIGRWKEGAE